MKVVPGSYISFPISVRFIKQSPSIRMYAVELFPCDTSMLVFHEIGVCSRFIRPNMRSAASGSESSRISQIPEIMQR